MQNIHLQFNSDLIKQIEKFCVSQNDVLLFYSPSGTGKNAILNIALNKKKDNALRFYYYCNPLTVIEDLLLGFYDTLRDYTIQKKIILKKDLSDDFTKKVSNYMKALSQEAFVIIDNYDKIQNNESINEFLSGISKQEKIKLILLSDNNVSIDKFQKRGLKAIRATKQTYDEDAIVEKISLFCPAEDLNSVRELRKISNENTVLLQATFNYINATDIRLYNIIDEFYKKNQSYENYITSKTLSLIPQNYMDSIKILSLADFTTTIKYLEKYSLFNIGYIPYLKQKLILNQINQNIYEYKNVSNYLSENLNIVDKIQYGDMIINSLNQELTLGPKDRTLRLSREGIRRQIEKLEKNVPHINPNAPSNAEVSYYSQTQKSNAPWLSQNAAPDPSEISDSKDSPAQQDLDMLRQFRQVTFENKNQEQEIKETDKRTNLIKQINEYENIFDFQSAINCLNELTKVDTKNRNRLLERIAENYSKLNKNDEAINYYISVGDNYKNENNERYYKILLKIASIKLKIYRLDDAGKMYEKVIKEDKNADNIIEAYCSLGNICEKKNEKDEALKNYENALQISLQNKFDEDASKIYYLKGAIFEKQNKIDKAKESYQNSIKYGKNNDILGNSYLSFASLLFDESDIEDAIKNFEKAITIFKQAPDANASSLYTANSNLAYIYKAINSDKEEICLTEALKWANNMGDKFEIANTYVTLGDFYYNKSMNEKALISYLHAQNSLNEDKSSQNQEIIASRIEDMKYKLGNDFYNIVKEYEQTRN